MPPKKKARISDQLHFAPPRPRGRPPKSANTSIASTSGTATPAAAPKKRGRPPKSAATAGGDVSTASAASKSTGRPRGRPKGSGKGKAKAKATETPKAKGKPGRKPRPSTASSAASTSYRGDTTAYDSPSEDSQASTLSVRSELSDSDSDDLSVVSESTLSSRSSDDGRIADDDGDDRRGRKRKRGWPSAKKRLATWRRLTLSEREAVTSEGGLVWAECREVMAPLSKKVRSIVADQVTALLARVERRLETGLVPPLLKIPGATAGAAAPFVGQQRRDVPSSLLSWRIQREGNQLLEAGDRDVKLGMDAEIAELEAQLLPEAEQAVDLTRAYRDQQKALAESMSRVQQLKRERKRLKAALRSPEEVEKIRKVVQPVPETQKVEEGLLAYF